MKLLKTLAISALSVALGVSLMLVPAFADLVVTYTLQTATLQDIKEVSVYRSGAGIKVSAAYEIVDETDAVRIPDGLVDDIALTGPELAALVDILSGPVLSAINEQEGL